MGFSEWKEVSLFHDQQTRCVMSIADGDETRIACLADGLHKRATRMEAASYRQVNRVRRFALEDHSFFAQARIGHGMTESKACVYGCFGLFNTSAIVPSSTMRPKYMTPPGLQNTQPCQGHA